MSTSDATTGPLASRSRARELNFPPLTPDLAERFELGELLGLGTYGEVYRAVDTALEREVALKLFGLHVPSAYIRHEALALARVEHKNVLSIHDLQVYDGRACLVMELVLGGSLHKRARQSESQREILGWFAQAARGLEAMHNAGLAHGDVKPSNILVHLDDRVVIADLGLVHGPGLRWRGRRSGGTHLYMAPERAKGARVEPRSDQFSLCVAVWEALYGEQLEVDRGRVTLRRVNTLRRFDEVPRELELGLRRGMSQEPTDRFVHMAELAALLEAHAKPRRSGFRRVLQDLTGRT